MGDRRGEYRVLVGHLMDTQLEKPRRRRKNNIKIDVQEVRWEMDWMYPAQDRDKWQSLVNMVMNLPFP